jgi:hypothetical protein
MLFGLSRAWSRACAAVFTCLILPPLLGPSTAAAEPFLQADAAVSVNDSGLSLQAKPGWRASLWDQDDSVLLDNTHVTPTAWLQITPDFARAGGEISFSPLAVFELRGHVLATRYFGNINTLIGFEDREALYGPSDREGLARSSGSTLRFGAAPILKAQVGSVVAVAAGEAQVVRLRSDVLTEPYWFDPESQLMLSRDETIFMGTGLLAWSGSVRSWDLLTGLLTTGRAASNSGDQLLRVGPMIKAEKSESKLSYLLLVQPYLLDRSFGLSQPYVAAQVRYSL